MVRFTVYPDRRCLNTALAVIVGFLQILGTAHTRNILVWQGGSDVLAVCRMSSCPAGLRGRPAVRGWLALWHQSSLLCSPGNARNPLRSSVVMGCCFFSQVKLHVQRYSQGFCFASVNKVMLIVLICSSCCDEWQC